jgi:hypothetical protein
MKRLAADRLAAMLAQKFHYVPPASVEMTKVAVYSKARAWIITGRWVLPERYNCYRKFQIAPNVSIFGLGQHRCFCTV